MRKSWKIGKLLGLENHQESNNITNSYILIFYCENLFTKGFRDSGLGAGVTGSPKFHDVYLLMHFFICALQLRWSRQSLENYFITIQK